jgi:PAS domain S-box-containing protein
MLAGKTSECRIPLRTRNGDRIPVETKVARGRWSDQDVLIGISRDMTEREQAEQELRVYKDLLERLVAERTAQLERANKQLEQELKERRQAQDALRESEARLRTAVENLPFDFFVIDENGRYAMYNSAVTEHWGDVIGLRPEDVAPDEETRATWKENNTRAFRGEIVKGEVEYSVRGKQGYYYNIIAPVRDGDQIRGILGVNIDITELKRVEEEKKRLEAQLKQAQKMEAIGTLAGGIAHDFNNILMGIQGNTSLMLDEMDETSPDHELLKNIEILIRSGAKLTNQLLGYARKGKYEVAPVNLNHIAAETAYTFGRTRKEITIQLELSEDLYPLEADQGQMEQVLMNLFVNAADAMPGGGDLILETVNIRHEDIRKKLYDAKACDYVLLRVTDSGTGIDPETLERIFEPFFTTKEMGRGTGLGLACVYGIIKGHGGHIEVESDGKKGTTFSVYLPASEKSVQSIIWSDDQIFEGSEVILLIDDEKMVLEVGTKILKKLGYMVFDAHGGREGVRILEEYKDRIDLVILDMVMPDMNGEETFARIREIRPDIKILLASGYSIDGEASRMVEKGCDAFIQKPFKVNDLSSTIRELLE